MFRQDFTCPALLVEPQTLRLFRVRGYHPCYGRTFQTVPNNAKVLKQALPRSLATTRESRLISFPPAT